MHHDCSAGGMTMAGDINTDELTSATIMILRRLRADAEAAIKLFEKIGADQKLIEQLRLSFEECENKLKALIVDVHQVGGPTAQ